MRQPSRFRPSATLDSEAGKVLEGTGLHRDGFIKDALANQVPIEGTFPLLGVNLGKHRGDGVVAGDMEAASALHPEEELDGALHVPAVQKTFAPSCGRMVSL